MLRFQDVDITRDLVREVAEIEGVGEKTNVELHRQGGELMCSLPHPLTAILSSDLVHHLCRVPSPNNTEVLDRTAGHQSNIDNDLKESEKTLTAMER